MQSTNFVALTGHLNEYPMGDLISILRRRRKTGRLLIEYLIGPCSFYFLDGNLVDAQLSSLVGLQAVLVALSQPNASFNFNPLIQPPRHSINESSQKVILELLGCSEEREINVAASPENGRAVSLTQSLDIAATPSIDLHQEALPRPKELLALPPATLEPATRRRHRQVLIASAIISLLVSFFTVAALTRWLIKRDLSTALSETGKKETSAGILGEEAGANAQTIKVSVRVEQGRVSQAFVEEHHPGMEAYEAMALKVARSLHYAQNASGQETVVIRINSHG
ncbi:MAG: hypothetical protein QOC96_2662 [Acidobacteriota bacterium]|jgi:hypothetical protein|nr:hypothetical protein [Acidobacteriota bacterium]